MGIRDHANNHSALPPQAPDGVTRGRRRQGLRSRPLVLGGRRLPLVLAHRGASATAPENSLLAFGRALDEGADALETDLRLTADGVIVCHHDSTTGRTAGTKLDIGRSTLADLRGVDLLDNDGRASGEVIPTLAEFLELTPPEVLVVLELKDPRLAVEPGVGRMRDLLGNRLANSSAVAISFSLARLVAARQAVPDLAIGHVTVANPLPVQPGELVGPYWPLLAVNPWYVAWAHRRGKLVCPLDPHLHRRLSRYLDLGVDAVLTDTPAVTRRAIERLRS